MRLIRSQAALDAAEAALKRPVARKRPVDVRVIARLGQPFTVELRCVDDDAKFYITARRISRRHTGAHAA